MLIQCDWCGYLGDAVNVHGHLQCVRCKTNIAPCCDGASAIDCAEEEDVIIGRSVCGVVAKPVG